MEKREEDSDDPHTSLFTLTIPMDTRSKHKVRHTDYSVLLPGFKRRGGGGGIEHLETVNALAHTLLQLTTIPVLCEHGKKEMLRPPLGETLFLCKTSSLHDSEQH